MTTYRKTMAEALKDVYLGENNLEKMRKASKGAAQTLKMKDGNLKMDSFTASAIMQIYDKINDKNKKTFEKMMKDGKKADIMKLQKFAMSKISSEYVPEEFEEEFELDEVKASGGYDLYHNDFSSAMQHAYKMAKKLYGITIDPKEIDDKVATGPKKPGKYRQNEYRLKGDKGAIQVQVYNKGGSKPFELNMYKEEVELGEGTWELPRTSKQKAGLKKALSKPIKLGKEGETAINVIGPFIGDDELFDDLMDAGDENPKSDARPIIKKAMKRLGIKEEVELDEKLKYEGKFKKGDTIKSFDFKGKKDRYISGKITGMEMRQGAKVYVIKITNDSGKTSGGRVGSTGYVPMETSMDYDGRIVKEEVELDEGYEGEVVKVLKKAKIASYFSNGILYVERGDGKDAMAALKKATNIKELPKVREEEVELDESKKALKAKSEKSGVSVGILSKVYDRGMAAWKTGHRPGTTPQQWALARVNSFLTGGGARKADNDLWQQAKKQKKEEVEIAEDGHADVPSAVRQCKTVMEDATQILSKLMAMGPEDSLPTWWTNKLAVASNNMNKMRDYLLVSSEMKEELEEARHVDPADIDTDATDDDVKSADKNIMMQMRKVISLRGNFKVEFGDKKKMKLPPKIAQAVQKKYDSIRRPVDKQKFTIRISKSYKDMLDALNEGFASDAQRRAAFAQGYKAKGKKGKKEETKLDVIHRQLKEK